MRNRHTRPGVFLAVASVVLTISAQAQNPSNRPIVLKPLMRDVSPPLKKIKPVRGHEPKEMVELHRPKASRPPSLLAPDTAIQSAAGPALSATAGLNRDGIGAGFSGPQGTFTPSVVPSDSNLAVGDTQVVQWVNLDFAVFDKATGVVLYGPAPGNTIWQGSGSNCATTNDGDPIVLYDKAAKRWLFAQFSVSLGPPYFECIAVSNSSDATGTYTRYVYEAPNGGNDFPDYPKLGIWPDGYYLTWNLFTLATTYNGPAACVVDRSAVLAGAAQPPIVCFNPGTSFFSLLPADMDGSTPPATGSPGLFASLGSDDASLLLWRLHADFVTPANSTFTGPTTIAVTAFTPACNSSPTNTCIPQPNTSQQLDSIGDRLMYRLSYRNFGDHESLLANHAVIAGSAVGIRWYELRDLFTVAPSVFQQSTYAPADSIYRWLGSIASDKAGDIALGYTRSGAGVFPGVAYTGRVSTDPVSTMGTEAIAVDGSGSRASERWGDYSSMSIDPVDDCTFWYTAEYQKTSGLPWNTRIASFSFPNCLAPGVADFSISATPGSQTIAAGGNTSYSLSIAAANGFNSAVALTAGGLPTGVNATFTPDSVVAPGSSTLNVTTAGTALPGSYPLTVTGTSGPLVHSQPVTLNIAGIFIAPNPLNFGAQTLGTKSAAGFVTLTNPGGSPLTIGSAVASGNFDAIPTAPTTCIGTIAAGASCAIYVTFTPTATGTRTGTLTITDSDVTSPQTVTLTGTGIGATVSPAGIAFAVRRVSTTSSAKTVKLTNIGKSSFHIQSPTITGANAADFTVAPALTSGCGTSLAAGASCNYNVRFRPTDKNLRTAILNVNDDWGSQPVALSGVGTIVKLSATSVSFGTVTVGTTARKTVTLTNVSTGYTLNFTGLTMSGSNPSSFTASGCSGSLVPGASCTVTIAFKPTSTNAKSATLNINDDGGGSPQKVKLSGS